MPVESVQWSSLMAFISTARAELCGATRFNRLDAKPKVLVDRHYSEARFLPQQTHETLRKCRDPSNQMA